MHHIYHTEGIILSSQNFGEAGKYYSIFTRDLGLVRASALGVRKEASKLRGSLEPVVLSKVSLVRGKEFWRLTSAEVIERVEPKQCALKPLALLETLVQGEDPNPELFEALEQALCPTLGVGHRAGEEEKWELGLVSQILYHLGYLKKEDLRLESTELIKVLNEGLQQSQLT